MQRVNLWQPEITGLSRQILFQSTPAPNPGLTWILYACNGENLADRIEIDAELFVAEPVNRGVRNWTLATRLGDMLHSAEKRFGPRDTTYAILGIEFAGERPMIWFPGDRKHIVVQLSLDCLTDLPRACYQLGHECIHLLAPTGRQDANNLEEGLATLFGEDYATKWFNTSRDCGAEAYERAKRVAQKAFSANPGFIREIRQHKPSFCDFTPNDILDRTSVTKEDAYYLCQPFPHHAG